jgi:sugar phosphate permease
LSSVCITGGIWQGSWAEVSPLTTRQSASGLQLCSWRGVCGGLGGIVGPLIMGYAYDRTGTFWWGFASLAAGAVAATLILLPITMYEKRVKREKREKAAQFVIGVREAAEA